MSVVYAIKRGRRTVAHLADGEFQPPLCGRPADLTSNFPGGKKTCADCLRIFHGTPRRSGVVFMVSLV